MFMFKKKFLSNVYKKMFFISNFSTQQTNFDVQFRYRQSFILFLKSSVQKAMFFILCLIPWKYLLEYFEDLCR